MCSMKAMIDDAGRLILPPEIRKAAGLTPGGEVRIRVNDGVIELEPVGVPRRLVQKGHVTAIVADVPVPPVTVEMVNDVLEAMRWEREGAE